jgi:hypothetical protein
MLGISSVISLLPLIYPKPVFLLFPGTLALALLGVFPATHQTAQIVSNFVAWPLALFVGYSLWRWGRSSRIGSTPAAVKALFIFWLILLIPWLLLAGVSGMAFDAGPRLDAYVFFWSTLTYPITLAIAAAFRKWSTFFVLLPLVNVAACCASGLGA